MKISFNKKVVKEEKGKEKVYSVVSFGCWLRVSPGVWNSFLMALSLAF